jgi:uncharacterized protein (DUF305 family)
MSSTDDVAHDRPPTDPPATVPNGDRAVIIDGPFRRALAAMTPDGPLQVAMGVFALCFLTGAIGYAVGTNRSPVPSSEVDIGFLLDMSSHHDQAITMALCAADRAEDAITRDFAKEVLVFQNRELGKMDAWLTERGERRPDEDEARPAMRWMGMQTSASQMPGMATQEQLDSLCSAKGKEIDRQFLQLLREHHRGGTHMAEVAAANAADPEIRELAGIIARNQKAESSEYTATLKKLGFE